MPPPNVRDRPILASLVVPARNEAGNVAWLLARLPEVVDEVILVDGESIDGTVAVARELRPDVIIVSEAGGGPGEALRAGAAAARGAFVVMLEADGSMDPGEIERFVRTLGAGHDVVRGSRFLPPGGTDDMTSLRRAGHGALLALANLLFGTRWTDLGYGFWAARRSALEALDLDADGPEIETQIALRARRLDLRAVEIPSFEHRRHDRTSRRDTIRGGLRVLETIVRERWPQGVQRAE